LLDIATWHASGEEDIRATFTLVNAGMAAGSGRDMPAKTTVKSTTKGANGRRKGQKRQLRRYATMTINDDIEEETDNSDEEFVVISKRGFKRHTRLPKDHLEKILGIVCLQHPYPHQAQA
jgi:hypothetical protein